jgi:hypothetical protein
MDFDPVGLLIAEVTIRDVFDKREALRVPSFYFFDARRTPIPYLMRVMLIVAARLDIIGAVSLPDLPNERGEYKGEINLLGTLDANQECLKKAKNELIGYRHLNKGEGSFSRGLYNELVLATIWNEARFLAGSKGIVLMEDYPSVTTLSLLKQAKSIGQVVFEIKQALKAMKGYGVGYITFTDLLDFAIEQSEFFQQYGLQYQNKTCKIRHVDRLTECFFIDYLGVDHWLQSRIVVEDDD